MAGARAPATGTASGTEPATSRCRGRRTGGRSRRRAPAPAWRGRASRSHSGAWVPVPASRRLDGESGRRVRAAAPAPGGRCPQGRRTWGPPASAATKPSTSPDRLELVGHRVVPRLRRAARRGLVLDAGGAADEDQPPDQVGPGEGGVEGEAGAERVAEQVERARRPPAGGQQGAAVREVGADVRRPAVAGQVDAQRAGGRRPSSSPKRPPEPPGLGEAVGEDERGAVADRLGVQTGGHTPVSVPSGDVQATFAATLVDEWVRAGSDRRGGLSGLAVDAAGAGPGGPRRAAASTSGSTSGAPGSSPSALGLGDGSPGRGLHDQRHGRGRAAPGGGRGPPRPGPADRLHGRPAARAPPRRRAADDRAGRPLRPGGALGRPTPGVADDATRARWRSLAARAVAEAVDGPLGPGPVHLNLAFRRAPGRATGTAAAGDAAGGPVHRRHGGPATAPAPDVAGWAGRAA